MKETQLFKPFVPKDAKYLFLGGFTATKKETDSAYDFYYSNKRNQFWQIIELVYGIKLNSTEEKIDLFTKLHFAIADTILKCTRKDGNSLDSNLTDFEYNHAGILSILKRNKIRKIFFTSRFAEKIFKKNFLEILEKFSHIELITLPSPSPRYAAMSKIKKAEVYRGLLPQFYQ